MDILIEPNKEKYFIKNKNNNYIIQIRGWKAKYLLEYLNKLEVYKLNRKWSKLWEMSKRELKSFGKTRRKYGDWDSLGLEYNGFDLRNL